MYYTSCNLGIQKNSYQGDVCEVTGNTVAILCGIIKSKQLLLKQLLILVPIALAFYSITLSVLAV